MSFNGLGLITPKITKNSQYNLVVQATFRYDFFDFKQTG
jgi:hypothetical protein